MRRFSITGLLFFVSPLLLSPLHFAEAQSKALFVFGDSVLDNGNNLFLSTSLSKADYFPYGIDMGGASGRFTNALNPADMLGEYIGLTQFIPCFLSPNATGKAILHGVNYGSAGSGILSTTLNTSSLPLDTQLDYFENTTLPDLSSQMTESELSSLLSEAIFVLNSGANDYEQNCFTGDSAYDVECQLMELSEYLVATLSGQIKRLYSLGARKFVLFGIQVIGCSPVARSKSTSGIDCMPDFNVAASLFNTLMFKSVDNLTQAMPGSHLLFVNTYDLVAAILDDPSAYGYRVDNASCCETSTTSHGIACLEDGTVCSNRTEYVFFDGVHPTERVYETIVFNAFYSNSTDVVYPFNVKTLAELKTAEYPGGSFPFGVDISEREKKLSLTRVSTARM